ncbi:YihY/virulence factor BrkB family protein [Oceaniglobus roseus]|uniref:YihY/virulence factor BrkB family protein n=1 Tax=Oceaniglobus roseus TaxID=1737570 RepID=UPI000C7F31A7|nr:YihY/virulence factor BrkB family protein [Kandeliimicrobium roseum]
MPIASDSPDTPLRRSKRKRAMGFGMRLWSQINEDHIGLIAAGVAFYNILALFPAITALMAIGGLLVAPSEIVDQIERFSHIVPKDVMDIIVGQATSIAGSREGGLGLAALVGISFSIWSASKGMGSLIEGMNVAYDEKETRGIVKLRLFTLLMTVLGILGLIFGMMATMAVPVVLTVFPLGPLGNIVTFAAVWGTLLFATWLGLSLIYRYGPDHSHPHNFDWKLPGAPAATLLWLVASGAFAFYVGNFASYNESFGSLAGVIVLLLWLWLSAYVVLLGAEVNAEVRADARAKAERAREEEERQAEGRTATA